MKLQNVFYGFTKDGKDRCLWKKNIIYVTELGDMNATVYYDLENKIEFDSSFVDEATLQPITNIMGNQTRKNKRKIVKVYQVDRAMLIDVKSVFYGDIILKTIIKDQVSKLGYRNNKPKKENVLAARIDDSHGRVVDLNTSKLYFRSEKRLEGLTIREVRPIDTRQFDERMQPKRKILEMDYRKEL